jgi:hypothetical protein
MGGWAMSGRIGEARRLSSLEHMAHRFERAAPSRIGGARRTGRGRFSVHDQSLLQSTVAELSFNGHLLN